MSRTYRTHLEWTRRAYGRDWSWDEEKEFLKQAGISHFNTLGWNGHYFVDHKCRDNKPWNKCPKWFKRLKRQQERSQVNTAMRSGRDIPVFPRNDQWEWS